MNTQNNSARVAVQAKPCPITAANKAITTLIRAVRAVSNQNILTTDCEEFAAEVGNVCSLAIRQLKGLRADKLSESELFFGEWDLAVSSIRLMLRACPPHEVKLRELLDETVQLSLAMADTVEQAFANIGTGHAG